MKKKFALKLAMASVILMTLSGCNKTILDTNYAYDKVHLYEIGKCYNIKEWLDYEGEQIQVKLDDGTVLLTSAQKAMLVKGNCPICDNI